MQQTHPASVVLVAAVESDWDGLLELRLASASF